MRFIDLASDGGCSKKADASGLQSLLSAVEARGSSEGLIDIARTLPDVAAFSLPSSDVLATVDVVFPMVLRADDFGTIAAIHALGDIHAALGNPHVALSIVGIPRGLSPDSEEIVSMLSAASHAFRREGVVVVGGHTLARQAELFLGFAIVGTAAPPCCSSRDIRAGDPILLTKSLGSGTASALWKAYDKHDDDFGDVLAGMKDSPASSASILRSHGVVHCTDVTGFGLINHLHQLLLRVDLAAKLVIDRMPIYKSLQALASEVLPTTSQYYPNLEYARRFSNSHDFLDDWKMTFAMDSQVSGGLLFTCEAERLTDIMTSLRAASVEVTVVGHCSEGGAGEIAISR